MRRILIITMNLYNGGAEKSLVNLLNEIDYSRYKIDLLLFQKKGLFLKQVPKEVNILKIPDDLYFMYNKPKFSDFKSFKNIKLVFLRFIYTLFLKVKYRKKNSREIRQIRWDKYYKKIISSYKDEYDVAISYLENEPMRYLVDKVNAKKKYAWLHNDYKKLGLNKEYDIYYYDKADKIITVSEKCLQVFNNVFPNFNTKSYYIPNISSVKSIYKMASFDCKYNYSINKFKIISIGRLDAQKGFDLAVLAANILKNKKISFEWFIIGDGIMKKELQKMINKYRIENEFKLIGVTDNPYPYIKNADILVQPSRFEGKSVVLDEAKILCKPFVVSKYPTVYDQANEDIAVLVDITPEGIANGIMELYKNPDNIKRLEKKLENCNSMNEDTIKKYYELFDE